MSNALRIEKLTEINYPSWAGEMEAVLEKEDLWDVVLSPDSITDVAVRAKQSRKAKASIRLCMSKQLQHLISGDDLTAKAAWDKLKDLNASSCKARAMMLKKELYSVAQLDGESCNAYFARADKIRQQLIAAGTPVSDSDYKTTLVGGLHGSFATVKEIVTEWIADNEKTAIDILSRLHVSEQQQPKRSTNKLEHAALATGSDSNIRCRYCKQLGHKANFCEKKKEDRRKKKCDYCHKLGHTKEECYSRKRDEAAENKGKASALIAHACLKGSAPAIPAAATPSPNAAHAPLGAAAAFPNTPTPKRPATYLEAARGRAAAAPTTATAVKRAFFPAHAYDHSDFMLREDLFLSLDDEFGPFDLDIAANESGGNAQCPDYLYKGGFDFFKAAIPEGARIYANPPFRSAGNWLERHKENKMRDPTVSAVWILPLDRDANWWHYTKGMKPVRVWNRGTHLFSMPGKPTDGGMRRHLKPCHFDVVAFYDPPLNAKGTALAANADTIKFVVDSGAAFHMTPRLDIVTNMRAPDYAVVPTSISAADGNGMRVMGIGDVTMEAKVGHRTQLYILKDVLYVPDLAYNLVSMAQLGDAGTKVSVRPEHFVLHPKDGAPPLKAHRRGNMYVLEHKVIKPSKVYLPASASGAYESQPDTAAAAVSAAGNQLPTTASDVEILHKRLGHLGHTSMAKLTSMVDGCKVSAAEIAADAKRRHICEHCMAGRQARDTRPNSQLPKTSELLHRVHTDLCGPFPESLEGNKYFLIAVDEASRYSALVPMERKSEAADSLWRVLSTWERRTDRRVKHIRCDQGREFLTNDLLSKLNKNGIKLETTATYSPESNGMAERCNRTIMEKVRAMMSWAQVPEDLWDEAAIYANILRNVSPAADLPKTPYEFMHNQRPDISHLRTFGSIAYVFIPKEHRHKLDNHSERGVLLSVDPAAKKYRVHTGKGTTTTRDAVCDETRPGWPALYLEQPQRDEQYQPEAPAAVNISPSNEVHSTDNQDSVQDSAQDDTGDDSNPSNSWETADPDSDEEVSATRRRYPTRERRVPEFYGLTAALPAKIMEPTSVVQAKASPEWPEWEQAMQAEMDALLENGTWELAATPPGVKPLPCKWVFKIKWAADGGIERFKARLVVGGHRQVDGVDYSEVYAPVGRFASLRALLGKAAHEDLELAAIDISNAFLHGELDHPIYMRQPVGFYTGNADITCKLNKTLYGLKQSPKEWYEVLSAGLTSFGFNSCEYDRALWSGRFGNHAVHLLHWVDDIIIASDSKTVLNDVKTKILSKFKGRDLGDVEQYLNIKIRRNRQLKTLQLSQPTHVSELLEKFNLLDCKPRTVPMLSSADVSKIKTNENPFESKRKYQ